MNAEQSVILPSPVGPLMATIDASGSLISFGLARVELPSGRPRHPTLVTLGEELLRYWAGDDVRFSVPTNPPGTDFQRRVWAALRELPWGRTITYTQLAARVGSNARAVGQANGANPVAIVIPCHRVIGMDGSLVGYAGGLGMKRALLRIERCLLL